MTDKIELKGITKIFGPHPEVAMRMLQQGIGKNEIMEKTGHGVGVADVSFNVQQGEILVIMGLSGSGKSTLVRCLNRLIEPTAGSVIVDGEDVTALDHEQLRMFRQKHFGMVFQHFALFPHRTVVQNVAYGLEIQKVDAKQRFDRAMQALEQVGLKGWEETYPSQLSGGMQQRVGLARALALNADIMLMDEAFSALDPLIRRDMQDELLALQEQLQKTIVFISHDLDEALKLGNRIVLMKDGCVVQQGTAEEILTNPADGYVARFVADVDMSKVLTAESVMIRPSALAYLKTDGPKTALHKMKAASISSIFVRHEGKVVGMVTADEASAALKRGEKSLGACMRRDFARVAPETLAIEMFQILADNSYPVAVVNESGKLVGVVIKGSLLAGLAECAQTGETSSGETS